MSSCTLAVTFTESLSASGMLPEPRRPSRKPGQLGASLMLHGRNRKAIALARVKLLPFQQGGRQLLAFFVQMGRGKGHRSWWKDEHIAEVIPRSGGGSYSVQTVRRWRRVLDACGLIRCTYVPPGGVLPDAHNPDLDAGLETETGQTVVSVNMDALLGLAPVWEARPRAGGYLDAREAKAAALELREELEEEAAARAALEPDAPPEDPGDPPEGVIMGDPGRVIIGDHSFSRSWFSSGEQSRIRRALRARRPESPCGLRDAR